MTHEEKLAHLTEWQRQMQAAAALIEPLGNAVGLSPESPIYRAVWGLQDAYTKAVGRLVGDDQEWLSWFASDNDFGRLEMEAGFPGRMIAVKTVADLIDVMEQEK